jgi:hypothetical protein
MRLCLEVEGVPELSEQIVEALESASTFSSGEKGCLRSE